MDLDEEGRLKNVFWADTKSRAAYKEFGDVITFDTTYLTNQYDMPFAPFVGVNHHGQSVLLGCALICNEEAETFIWLFRSWLACMCGHAPKAIITDQDQAMRKAIEIVFPNTRHRWCLWHIMKKLPEKLKSYKHYKSIRFDLQVVVYDSLTQNEFEEQWIQFIEKYELQSNDWLSGLYNDRRWWVPAFVKYTLWAGMSTTKRSESMNSFFDGYVNSNTTLKQFVEQYENALRDKVEKEKQEDFNSYNSLIPCISKYEFEKQFKNAYTRTKFKEFQEEVATKVYCHLISCQENESSSEFVMAEDLQSGETFRRVDFTVTLNLVECDVNCKCQLFEFRGILCQHAIVVLLYKEIFLIPDKYLLKRWRRDVKGCHTKVKICYDNWSVKPETQRFDKLCSSFYDWADLAAEEEEDSNMVIELIRDIKQKLMLKRGIQDPSKQKISATIDKTQEGEKHDTSKESQDILNPKVVRRKGRPAYKRKQSKIEVIAQNKRKRKAAKVVQNISTSKDVQSSHGTQQNILNRELHNSMNSTVPIGVLFKGQDDPSEDGDVTNT